MKIKSPSSVRRVVELLQQATIEIAAEYFRLPVTDMPLGSSRERVYCYELYSRLQSLWPDALQRYSLAGEVDKASHPRITRTRAKNKKPDFIIHSPGNMDDNLAVIEVKRTTNLTEVQKDMETLKFFKSDAGYQAGVLLLFGPSKAPWNLIRRAAEDEGVDLRDYIVLHHEVAGQAANRIEFA